MRYITMGLLQLAQVAVVFYALVPGILLSIPAGANRATQAAVHAIVFAVVLALTGRQVKKVLQA